MYVDRVRFDDRGLLPAIICDHETNEVLMVGYMNEEALRQTIEGGKATFFSRSRQKLWVKGETSGHVQRVRWIRLDCDGDALLVGVEQVVGACHLGYRSCFFRELRNGTWVVITERVFEPKEVYRPQSD